MNPLENARTDLAALLQQREAIDRKINSLNEAIKILETVYRPVDTSPLATMTSGFTARDIADLGLTSAVERVLMELPNLPFPPVRVRDTLVGRGFILSGDNPMASIHQVLKRLVAKQGSPFLAIEVDGQTTYIYNPNRAEAEKRSTGQRRHLGEEAVESFLAKNILLEEKNVRMLPGTRHAGSGTKPK